MVKNQKIATYKDNIRWYGVSDNVNDNDNHHPTARFKIGLFDSKTTPLYYKYSPPPIIKKARHHPSIEYVPVLTNSDVDYTRPDILNNSSRTILNN